MAEVRLGIVFVGATGELARQQHLPALTAIRDEGGLSLASGDRVVPDVLLVGRDPERLARVARETGFPRTATDLTAALASPSDTVVFDAAPSGGRADRALAAITAGKHVYLEKPVADSVDAALRLRDAAVAAGVKHGTVQDKLFLPGFHALLALSRGGFFGRILELRIEMGRWIFDGERRPGQRPSWNYRRRDGGGLILDMFPHWRYMIDHLAGGIRAVSAMSRTQVPQRRDEAGRAYAVDVEDSVFADLELADGGIASVNCSWATRARREFAIQVQIDGTEASAVAGPFGCWTQTADRAPGGAIAAALPGAVDLLSGWDAVAIPPGLPNSYRTGWDAFIRHVCEDAPFPYDLLEGAKGVQFAQAAYHSVRERRWIDLPPLA